MQFSYLLLLHVNIDIYYTIPRPMAHKHTPFPQSLFLASTRRLRLGHSPVSSLIVHTVVVVVITTVVATTVILTTTDIVTVVVTTVFLTMTTAVTAFVTTIIITAAVILVIVITIITSASLTALRHSSVIIIMSFVE